MHYPGLGVAENVKHLAIKADEMNRMCLVLANGISGCPFGYCKLQMGELKFMSTGREVFFFFLFPVRIQSIVSELKMLCEGQPTVSTRKSESKFINS